MNAVLIQSVLRLGLRMKNDLNIKSRIILALDYDNVEECVNLIRETKDFIGVYKLGLEFFVAQGMNGVLQIKNQFPDIKIFLDLKLHDIPNTVKGAALAINRLNPLFLTVHASGGQEMIRAATNALPDTYITAVTVLTSLDSQALAGMGMPSDSEKLAVQLALSSVESGARAIVCSPLEVAKIRAAVGDGVVLITPGVRPANTSLDDQKRVMSPEQALKAGSDLLVIGRPITQSANPGQAAAEIYKTLA